MVSDDLVLRKKLVELLKKVIEREAKGVKEPLKVAFVYGDDVESKVIETVLESLYAEGYVEFEKCSFEDMPQSLRKVVEKAPAIVLGGRFGYRYVIYGVPLLVKNILEYAAQVNSGRYPDPPSKEVVERFRRLGNVLIEVFSSLCPACLRAAKYLSILCAECSNVSVRILDVSMFRDRYMEYVKRYKRRVVPVIYINGEFARTGCPLDINELFKSLAEAAERQG